MDALGVGLGRMCDRALSIQAAPAMGRCTNSKVLRSDANQG